MSKSIITHYTDKITTLLDMPCNFYMYRNKEYIELQDPLLYYTKDSKSGLKVYLKSKNIIIARFTLIQLTGCCGICVSTGAYVEKAYRSKGIGKILNQFRKDIAKYMGYTILMCTDQDKNLHQKKILDKEGFKHIYKFKNNRTNNSLNISIYDFSKE